MTWDRLLRAVSTPAASAATFPQLIAPAHRAKGRDAQPSSRDGSTLVEIVV
ncbi:hypothetical protein [Acetobacter nitrogenifigens]|uniref:hypothetical protein n=1 Tax=Acetobacter nitrogenifigens TaxID=285268 RepID=UPI0004186DC0|nr:hypothetical protein [Acetobacter nitrogenifigens]